MIDKPQSLSDFPSATSGSPALDEQEASTEDSEPELICSVRNCISESDETVELCEEGVGGTYFIYENNKKIAVFKPIDEEPGASNNPKASNTPKPLLPHGGGARREVAAYLLDNGRAGVPETYFLENVTHSAMNGGMPKSGSVQKFIENVGDSSTMSPSRFATSDVHNIGILDLRLFNMDRNEQNILVKKISEYPATPGSAPGGVRYQLVPIDHTYSLPPTLEGAWFEWHHWRQAKEKFSEETLEFIRRIDVEKDVELLRKVGIEEEGINTMKISTTFLKNLC